MSGAHFSLSCRAAQVDTDQNCVEDYAGEDKQGVPTLSREQANNTPVSMAMLKPYINKHTGHVFSDQQSYFVHLGAVSSSKNFDFDQDVNLGQHANLELP
jgi:hypothetical protein